MKYRIALAGNSNCGKTTLFNALTGSNQFVGNWPGVTVEKKEGRLKNYDGVTVTDLPGIYSLSPYTPEEVIARNYLLEEKPDAILNIIDGTNLERNLYLTTQLTELGIPVVIAVNMTDLVRKNGDKIDIRLLSAKLGCKVVEISALKGTGISEAAKAAVESAKNAKTVPAARFSEPVEQSLERIERTALTSVDEKMRRWYAVKIFERDEKALKSLSLGQSALERIEGEIASVEEALDEESESIITNERYCYISSVIKECYHKKNSAKLSVSDKIDKVVTNRFAALPIFAVIMFLVYYISVSTVGAFVTDWTNDGLFGDGFHLFSIGTSSYNEAITDYACQKLWTDEMTGQITVAADNGVVGAKVLKQAIDGRDFGAFEEAYEAYCDSLEKEGYAVSRIYDVAMGEDAEGVPDPSEYGIWVPGIPVLVESGLEKLKTPEWLNGLILDGIVGGVGAVLGFVPQMIVLFIFLALLEACGYMARIAFVFDRVFRRFGLSGKSFIPMLIGTGCGVPGIMASRTIENERDRRMTIMTTTFIPCGAKLPIIALISTALFGSAWWVAPSAYFIGIAAIVISGIILKKTKMFSGEVSPFVMELPVYHLPTFSNVTRSVRERVSSFIKKAGTVILLSSIVIWAGSSFGIVDGALTFSEELELSSSFLGIIGAAVSKIFVPLGFGSIKATVATVMGLVAKEEVVGVFGVLDFEGMTKIAAYSFLVFNLLCAPCFAAVGAIRREMNSAKWTWFAVGYQCAFAYAVSLMIYQFGSALTGNISAIGLAAAMAVLAFMLYMLVRPDKETTAEKKLTNAVRTVNI